MTYHSPIKALAPGTRIDAVTTGGVLHQTAFTLHYALNGQDETLVEFAPAGAAERASDSRLDIKAEAVKAFIQAETKASSTAKLFKANGTAYYVSALSSGQFLSERINALQKAAPEDLRSLLLSLCDQLQKHTQTGLHHGALAADYIYVPERGAPIITGWGAYPAAQVLGLQPDPSNTLTGEARDVYALSQLGYQLVTGQAPAPFGQRKKALEDGLGDPLVPAGEYADASAHGSIIRAISRGLSLNGKSNAKTLEDWAFTVEGRSRLMTDGAAETPAQDAAPMPPSTAPVEAASGGASSEPQPAGAARPTRPMRPKSGAVTSQSQKPANLSTVALILIGLAVITGFALFASQSGLFAPNDADEPEVAAPEVSQPSAQEERAWVNARTIDSLSGYEAYLSRYPAGFYLEEARARLDALDDAAWQAAIAQNTLAGYRSYMEAFALGMHVPEAQKIIDRLEAGMKAMTAADTASWNDAQRVDTVAAYDAYISAYPDGQFVREARERRTARLSAGQDDQAFEAARNIGTKMAYQSYLNRFPQGKHTATALSMLDRLTTRTGDVFKGCAQCPNMVVIPSGTFDMGAGDDDPMAKPSEKPQRSVTISAAFALGQTEVTVGQWKACAAAGACRYDPKQGSQDNLPVLYVSWDDASAYAAWLAKTTGKAYRLPSEAEWEYAGRAGSKDIFAGGRPASVCRLANIAGAETNYPWRNTACDDGVATGVETVRRRQANAFGLYDMTGNAAEWTQDCASLSYRDAPTSGIANERGLCSSRIARGGSWISGPRDFRLAARMVRAKGDTDDTTGMRVALTLPK